MVRWIDRGHAGRGVLPSATHTIVPAGKEDETCLVRRILPTVTEDQQPFFGVVIRAVTVGLVERFEQTFCHHL